MEANATDATDVGFIVKSVDTVLAVHNFTAYLEHMVDNNQKLPWYTAGELTSNNCLATHEHGFLQGQTIIVRITLAHRPTPDQHKQLLAHSQDCAWQINSR